ncbi:MAG TPA: peptidoglycan bridge formation glycyltransferase FemA/FemB family protein [Patescibacteria group bacterium]|nr:peptidoglycan bridge formation glycyltransferase FemA/FemB family protein [Patescibacteria group bacterium]
MTPELDRYHHSVFGLVTDPGAWRGVLMSLPNPHPLQSWPWAQLKNDWGWSASLLRLDVHDDHERQPPLAAALVLKRKLIRLPLSILYVPKGPILDYNDGALRRVALVQLEQIARAERAIFVKIDPDVVSGWGSEEPRLSPTGAKFVQELEARGWRFSDDQVQFRNTVELDLGRSEDELLASMKQKTRYNIRLAGRKGIAIRKGTAADFELIAKMYIETAIRDGFAVRPVKYYLDAWHNFYTAGLAQPFIAEFERQPLAAVIIVRYGKRAIYMYGASTNQERKRMPNHLLQWEAILWARAEGCETYDFWGAPDEFVESDPLWGVWRFKEGFNGQVVRHIGAWDFPARPFWYWTYSVVIPKYISYLRSRNPRAVVG